MLHSVFPRTRDILFRAIMHIPFVLILLAVFAVPLLFSFRLGDGFTRIKLLFISTTTLLAVFFWLLRAFISRKVIVYRSFFDIPILIFFGGVILSTIASLSSHVSFFGGGGEGVANFHFWFFPILLFWLILQECVDRKKWYMLLVSVLAGGTLSGSLYLLFHSPLLHQAMLSKTASQMGFLGRTNLLTSDVGVFLVYMLVLLLTSLGVLLMRSAPKYLFVSGVCGVLISSIVLLVTNSSFVFFISVLGLFLLSCFVMFFHSQLDSRKKVFLSVFTSLFLLVGFLGHINVFEGRILSEVTLHPDMSVRVVRESLLGNPKDFLLGSGPGTFGYQFSRFRVPEFNVGTFYFLTQNIQSFSALHAMLVELGFVFTTIFVLLPVLFFCVFLTVLFRLFSKIRDTSVKKKQAYVINTEGFFVGLSFLFFCSVFIFFSVSFPVLVLWWVFFALAVIGLSFLSPNIRNKKTITFALTPEYELGCVVGLVVSIMGGIILFAFQLQFYEADIAFSRLNHTHVLSEQDAHVRTILEKASGTAMYHHAFAQMYLERAAMESKKDVQKITYIQKNLTLAGNAARRATEIDPNNGLYWATLGSIYLQTVDFVPEADEWARFAYEQAVRLQPTNPRVYFYLGYIAEKKGEYDKAMVFYEKSISMKADYVIAFVRLAHTFSLVGETNKAMAAQQNAVLLAPKNVDILYNYGRMLFNRGFSEDIILAKEVWGVVQDIDPNHANTLFSLGVLHEESGDTQLALSYYKRVASLNPSHKGVQNKITALVH